MSNVDETEFFIEPDKVSQIAKNMAGFVKIWSTDKETGKSSLLVDKQNLILYQGATILSNVLSGNVNSNLNYFYIGYNNNNSFTPPLIDLAYSVPFSGYTAPFGYLRLPLSFNPSFLSDAGYTHNTSVYTVQIASATAYQGAAFTSGTSNIYECALVSAPNPASPSQDLVFSRINFNQIQYNSSQALTIAWGVKFLCS